MVGKNMKCKDDRNIELLDFINSIRGNILFVMLITIVFGILGGLASYFLLQPVYEARAILMVAGVAETQQNTMNTYVGQVKSDVLMQRVINKMQLNERVSLPDNQTKNILGRLIDNSGKNVYTPRNLSKLVKVSGVKESSLIEITVSNNDKNLASEIANTLSNEFMGLIAENNREMINQSVAFLQNQITSMQREMENTAVESQKVILGDTIALLGEKARISRSIDLSSSSVVIISPALTPGSPVAPNKKLNIILSLCLGFLVAVALVFVREYLDNTIKTPDDVENLGLQFLGAIYCK